MSKLNDHTLTKPRFCDCRQGSEGERFRSSYQIKNSSHCETSCRSSLQEKAVALSRYCISIRCPPLSWHSALPCMLPSSHKTHLLLNLQAITPEADGKSVYDTAQDIQKHAIECFRTPQWLRCLRFSCSI